MTWKEWLPIGIALFNALLAPAILALVKSQIKLLIEEHDNDPNAHPASRSDDEIWTELHEIRKEIEKTNDKLTDLRLAVGQITPRRRQEDQ